jgi:hypothetical protein
VGYVAMAQIDTELKHLETIGHDIFSETGIDFPLLFGLGGKVKKNKYPHDPICV